MFEKARESLCKKLALARANEIVPFTLEEKAFFDSLSSSEWQEVLRNARNLEEKLKMGSEEPERAVELVLPYKLGFKIAPPPQWEDFVQLNPLQQLYSLYPRNFFNFNSIPQEWMFLGTLLKGLHSIPYVKDRVDKWELKLPGDCDEFAIFSRALILGVYDFAYAATQFAIVDRPEGQHMVLVIYAEDNDKVECYVFDPIFNFSSNLKNYHHDFPVRVISNGLDWHLFGGLTQ